MKLMALLILIFHSSSMLAVNKSFLLSAGGWDYCKKDSGYSAWQPTCDYQNVKNIERLIADKKIPVNSVSVWITRNWQENWYPAEEVNKKLVANGITPIFIFYWYADDISKKFVLDSQQSIERDLQRFEDYLRKINGKKLVVLHPEFNQADISQWQGFNQVMSRDINRFKNVANTKVGFCVGDFGNYHSLSSLQDWKSFHPSIKSAVNDADFIAFQEMRATTRNSQVDILNTAKRSLSFATYLHKTYQKPTLFAYLALSSYGKNGEENQAKVIKETLQLLPRFKEESNLIGFNLFHLMDSPRQEGYFLEAEKNFGIYRKDGSDKPSAKYLQTYLGEVKN